MSATKVTTELIRFYNRYKRYLGNPYDDGSNIKSFFFIRLDI